MESAQPPQIEGRKRRMGSSKHAKRRARKAAAENDEEDRLADLLFGTSRSELPGPMGTALEKESDHMGALDFEIDRTGVVEPDDLTENENEVDIVAQLPVEVPEPETDDEDGDRPAWVDEDDENLEVDLLQTSRLRKLRKTRDEAEASALAGSDYAARLRERFKSTVQRTARTDWAEVNEKGDDDDEDNNMEDDEYFIDGPLARGSSRRLPPNLLNVVRCPDANQSDPSSACVQSVHFHPGSEPDRPLMLTAGMDKTLRFFQVGAEESVKVHGIHFPRLPIYSAHFVGKSGSVVVTGRRPFFYVYDAIAGKLDQIPGILGRREKSWEKSVASPDGKTVALYGNDGYVILFDIATKQTRAEYKVNGSVRAITFSGDGDHIFASGSDGEVYRWDLRSKKCLERFANEDGTITSSLAVSSNHVAVGAESGVVNLYSGAMGQSRKPIKSIMNLQTSADALRFNSDGQILAMSTRRDKQTLKLLHVPSATVFSNWPTTKTPLGYVWSMDFSPESKFFAIGNDKGKCLLYNLEHYSSKD